MRTLTATTAALAVLLAVSWSAACGDDSTTATPDTSVTETSVTDAGGTDASVADSTDTTTPPDVPSQMDIPDVPIDTGPLPEGVFAGLPTDAAVRVPGLGDKVSVVYDERGIPHIYGGSLEDIMVALGYVHSVDRYPMMELFKRVARGRLGELLGGADPGMVRDDIVNRTLGFSRVGDQMYAALEDGSRVKRALDAYAKGVNAYIAQLRTGERRLAAPFDIFIPEPAIEDWVPSDCLALGRVQAHSLSFDSDHEIGLTAWAQAIKAAFSDDAADPDLVARAGFFADVYRFAPIDPAVQYAEYPPAAGGGGGAKSAARAMDMRPGNMRTGNTRGKLGIARPRVSPSLLDRAARFISGTSLITELGERGASNNWAVGPSRTANGHAIVCNDPHLGLDNPPLFYFSHLVLAEGSPDGPIDAIGGNFPGIPGFLIGHSQKTAWVLTTSADDRTDAYLEQLTVTADGATTTSDGQELPVTVMTEEIGVGLGGVLSKTLEVPVYITAQGRVLVPELTEDGVAPFESGEQLSYAWAGFGPSDEIFSVFGALYAKNAAELRDAFFDFHVANQNILGGDVEGNIFGLSPGGVPLREAGAMTWDPETNPEGTAPWWILPGDGGADWTGSMPGSDGPQVMNPAKGFVVTANEDHAGQTLDNHPLNDSYYLGYEYSLGLRSGRIHALIDGSGAGSPAAGGAKLGLDEMLRIQTDTRSGLGALLRDAVVVELDAMIEELDAAGTHADLTPLATDFAADVDAFRDARDRLASWDLETPTGLDEHGRNPSADDKASAVATTLWNIWLVDVLKGLFGDENAAVGQGIGHHFSLRALVHLMTAPADTIATWDKGPQQSVLWDRLDTPDVYETKRYIIVRALFEALRHGREQFPEGTPVAEWYWGELHRLKLDSLLPVPGGALDLPPPGDPRAGKGYARPGGQHAVNVCNPGSSDYRFTCGSGPIMRMCVELDPAGVKVYQMMPGGQSMDRTSRHYGDWVEDWMAHRPYYWAFHEPDVRAKAERHLVLAPRDGGD